MQIIFQIKFRFNWKVFAKTNQTGNNKAIEPIADGTISTVDRYPRGFTSKFV